MNIILITKKIIINFIYFYHKKSLSNHFYYWIKCNFKFR